jgi:hypothetical protein
VRFRVGDRGCRGLKSAFSAAARPAEDASGRIQLSGVRLHVTGDEGGLADLLEEEVKGKRGRRGGVRSFIDVESGTGPVHAPCRTRRSLNPGGKHRD